MNLDLMSNQKTFMMYHKEIHYLSILDDGTTKKELIFRINHGGNYYLREKKSLKKVWFDVESGALNDHCGEPSWQTPIGNYSRFKMGLAHCITGPAEFYDNNSTYYINGVHYQDLASFEKEAFLIQHPELRAFQ